MVRKESLSSSDKTFPDGANYRIEVSGIETAEILESVVDEAKKMGIPIHRAIATVAGSKFYTDEQLKELAKVAAKNKIEVIICPWKLARLVLDNPNRILTDLKFEDIQEIDEYLLEIHRCTSLGFRCFLVWYKYVLELLDFKRQKKEDSFIPSDVIFKLSTFANNLNFLNFVSAVRKGANTINTANGLSLKKLDTVRYLIPPKVKLDVHITFWQLFFEKNEKGKLELAVKPYDRIKDAPEIARICSPVYFKFEAGTPGISVYDVPRPDWTFKDLAEHKRKDVRVAAQIVRRIKAEYPDLKLSDWGPEDLRVPVVHISTVAEEANKARKALAKNTKKVEKILAKRQEIMEEEERKRRRVPKEI